MKQVLQNLKTGEIEVPELPAPAPAPQHLLIRTRASLISAGTERASIASGKESLLTKARRNPDKVVQVLKRVGREGLGATVGQVQTALERLAPLGYSNVGEVVAVGDGVHGFEPGQRVASNGAHAEIVSVPGNLCQLVPDGVDDEAAAFTVLGAIALQSVRLAAPTLGETFAVSGLGLVGLLAVQLLRASGARVLGLDFVPSRLELARGFGAIPVDLNEAPDPARACRALTRGRGVDGVIVAVATDSSAPMAQAAAMCRKRGRIVLVGVAGLELSRDAFYEKELSFQVSCSYGPGRYDPAYEAGGQDYPLGFVRWTAGRNFEAVLEMLADARLDVRSLISDRIPIESAPEAYRRIGEDEGVLGVLFRYPEPTSQTPARTVSSSIAQASRGPARERPKVGLIGAGAYAAGTLLPALQAAGADLATVVGRDGANAMRVARRFHFQAASTDPSAVLEDPSIECVVIATPHDSHAQLAAAALRAGKHVFVEKPLATDWEGLHLIEAALRASGGERLMMVGFNRRFSPHVIRMRELLANRPEPKVFSAVVNAGEPLSGHWTSDSTIGGGRLIGEGCHFIDLLCNLAGAIPEKLVGHHIAADPDCFILNMSFGDGSLATLSYLTNGHPAVPKERIEVYVGNRILRLDNFHILDAHGWGRHKGVKTRKSEKGNRACIGHFVEAIRCGRPPPIPPKELLANSALTLRAFEAVRDGRAWCLSQDGLMPPPGAPT